MPSEKRNGPLVAVLLYDGLCTFEFGIVAEIFGLERLEFGADWYRFISCAIEPGPLRAHGGFSITPDHGPDGIEQADLVVIPGWKGADQPVPEDLCHRLRKAHENGARLASICSGAFVLAATGLLKGQKATTHWRYAEKLRQSYPEIEVDEASLYRQQGRIFTSAGSAAGLDLMLELVRQDYGNDKANSVARRLVLPAHRTGDQAQFLERPVPLRQGAEIAPVLERVQGSLADEWTIGRMADCSGMSARTFQRRFIEATGQPPGDWLTQVRIEATKKLLVEGTDDMETIAMLVGFGSAHALRHHFRKRLGIRPTDFRRQFGKKAA